VAASGKSWTLLQVVGAAFVTFGLVAAFGLNAPDLGAATIGLGLMTWLVGRVGGWWQHG